MEKSFFKTLFWPLALMLALLTHVEYLSLQMRSVLDFHTFMQNGLLQLPGIIIFSALLLLAKKCSMKKLFRGGLILIAIFFTAGAFSPQNMMLRFVLFTLSFNLSAALGWIYVNQQVPLEKAIRYYFLLNLTAIVLNIPLNFATIRFHTPTHYVSGVCALLILIFLLTQFLEKRKLFTAAKLEFKNPGLKTITALTFSFFALTTICSLISTLLLKKTFDLMPIAQHPEAMQRHGLYLGVGILTLSIILLYAGPAMFKNKGWKYSIWTAGSLAALTTLLAVLKPMLTTLSSAEVVLKAFDFAWIIPLMQIAFVSYAKETRAHLQAWVILVGGSVLQLATAYFETDNQIFALSAVLFVLLLLGSRFLAKANPKLA